MFKEHAGADGSWRAQIINPNLWQPLSIYNAKLGMNVTQKFTTPQWLDVTSFALTCGTEFLAPAADIYQYGSLGYVAQARRCLLGQLRLSSGCWRSWVLAAHSVRTAQACAWHEHASPFLCQTEWRALINAKKSTTCAAWLALTQSGVSGRPMSCWHSRRR